MASRVGRLLRIVAGIALIAAGIYVPAPEGPLTLMI